MATKQSSSVEKGNGATVVGLVKMAMQTAQLVALVAILLKVGSSMEGVKRDIQDNRKAITEVKEYGEKTRSLSLMPWELREVLREVFGSLKQENATIGLPRYTIYNAVEKHTGA